MMDTTPKFIITLALSTVVLYMPLAYCGSIKSAITPSTTRSPEVLPSLIKNVESIGIDKKLPLVFDQYGTTQAKPLAMSWQTLAKLQFNTSNETLAGAGSLAPKAITTGFLTWKITPSGTRVFNSQIGKYAEIPALTSTTVRPRDLVFDQRNGIVWFYGTTVYRYRIANQTIEKLQLPSVTLQSIRKAVIAPTGLWLATEDGVFLLDKSGTTLQKIEHSKLNDLRFINIAASDSDIWLVSDKAQLIRLAYRASNHIELAISSQLAGAIPAEIFIANRTVWMLLSNRHGEDYKLGFLDTASQQLQIFSGKYFSLREEANDQLMASTYSTTFRIDPVRRTLTKLPLAESAMLADAIRNAAVLFVGASYGYKDNCEIVERGKLDISKGWINNLLAIQGGY